MSRLGQHGREARQLPLRRGARQRPVGHAQGAEAPLRRGEARREHPAHAGRPPRHVARRPRPALGAQPQRRRDRRLRLGKDPHLRRAEPHADERELPRDRPERINLLGTEKIIKTWKGGNSHVKYEKNRTNSPL